MDSPSRERDDGDLPTAVFEPPTRAMVRAEPGRGAPHDPRKRTLVRTPPPADGPSRVDDPAAHELDEPTAREPIDADPGFAGLSLGPRPRDEPGAQRLLARLETQLLGREPQPIAGRYTLLGKLGAGGIGVVYGAYDAELDRKVALKFLQPSGDDLSGRGRQRLVREAQALAKLSHPNVVTVYDVGTADDQVFIAMELVDGVSLSTWWRAKPRPWNDVREMMVQAARGLVAAHDAGLIHRDFKPANVLVGADGRVRVLDFGLARRSSLDERSGDDERPGDASRSTPRPIDARVTMTGTIMGTPAYMAPEQLRGEEVGPAADQFAFCVALFEGVYGRRPFPGNDLELVRDAILAGRVTPPDGPSEVPPWLHRALLRGLAVEPERRFADMRELVAAITADQTRRRRKGWIFALVGALTIGAVAGGLVLAQPAITESDRARVDELVAIAEAAAERGAYLYPPPGESRASTALGAIRELEQMSGAAGELARERAAASRRDYAERLVALGDRYWDDAETRAFAGDYYSIALAFDSDLERAIERATWTRGEIAAAREHSDEATFSPGELIAGQTLAVLAASDRSAALDELLGSATPPSPTTVARLESIVGRRAEPSATPKSRESRPSPPRALPEAPIDEGPIDEGPIDEGPIDEGPIDEGPIDEGPIDAAPAPIEPQPAIVPAGPAPLEQDVAPRPGDRQADVAEWLSRAAAAKDRRDTKTAEQLYNRVLGAQRNNVAALRGLAGIAFDRSDYHEVIRIASRAIKAAPKDSGLRMLLGDALYRVADYDAARQQYTAAKALGAARASERLAMIRDKLGESAP